jgi:hypothetical protein
MLRPLDPCRACTILGAQLLHHALLPRRRRAAVRSMPVPPHAFDCRAARLNGWPRDTDWRAYLAGARERRRLARVVDACPQSPTSRLLAAIFSETPTGSCICGHHTGNRDGAVRH